MIRWRFVITRILVVVVVGLLLRFAMGPVVKYVTVEGLQSLTGAHVDIADATIGYFPPRLLFTDVRVADPRADKSMSDAVRAESIELVIDGDALLRRRYVARDGRISGLQIGARRDVSGHFDIQPVTEPASPSDGPSIIDRLIASATGGVGDRVEAVRGSLETVRRGEEIRTRWESEYESMVVRARELEKMIRGVRDRARSIDNPLRDWPELERTLTEARQARKELLAVRQRIDELPERLQNDLAALEEAKQYDLAKIDQYVPGDFSKMDEVGVDLVTDTVRTQIAKIRGYLDGSRKLAGYTIVEPESERIRGLDYDLAATARPGLLIRRCRVDGLLRNDGQTYAVTGIVENMTPTPQRLAEPTRARLRLEGPEIVRVDYVRDRRDGMTPNDLLTLHWPEMDARPVRFGGGDGGIEVSGGPRELWVQVETRGETITGRLVSKQSDTHLKLHADERVAELAAFESLRRGLADIEQIEIDARFAGKWSDMKIELNTNLGRALSRATRQAVSDQVAQSKRKVALEIQKVHTEQTVALRKWLAENQSEARKLLASADESIAEMNEKVIKQVGDADAYIGRLRGKIGEKLNLR